MARTRPGLGWVPDVPSIKDFTQTHEEVAPMLSQTRIGRTEGAVETGRPPRRAAAVSAAAAAAPAAATMVDLRADFTPIENQESLGSCTAHAAVGLIEYYEKKALKHWTEASRLFIYKVTRNLLGWKGDTGAYLRTTMQTLRCFGAPPEEYWPHDGRPEDTNKRFELEPTPFCYAFAQNYRSMKYYRLDPNGATQADVLGNVKNFLGKGFPCMFGFSVYQEFMDPLPGGKVLFPGPKSKMIGGHAVVAAGFDDKLRIGPDEGALLIRNSWGTGYGDGGYCWLPYRYVREGLADDFWTVMKQEWVDTGEFD